MADVPVRTFLIEPFDIMLHATEDGVQALQARFATWLRTLPGPARFFCWQTPASLDEKIAQVSRAARETDDPRRAALLMEYRRHYELLEAEADYQRTLCGMALWSDETPRALAGGMISAFDTPVIDAPLPRFQFVLDIQDEGIYWLTNARPPLSEFARFGTT